MINFPKRQEIITIVKEMDNQDAIDTIESIGKQLRKANSKKMNNHQMGRIVDIRPDEIILKANG